ncbi:unnamed protein product, partial [Vitrella brassicaformis CCMP3155]
MHGSDPRDGVMAACRLSPAEVEKAIERLPLGERSVSVAAVNGPKSVVLSGARVQVEELLNSLGAGSQYKLLPVSHAFHSPLMAGAVPQFKQVLQTVALHQPRIPLVSNVTGQLVAQGHQAQEEGASRTDVTDVEYWAQHITLPVRFLDGVQTIIHKAGARVLIEVGPKPILVNMAKQIVREDAQGVDLQWLPAIDPGRTNEDVIALAVKQAATCEAGAHQWSRRSFPWADIRHPLLQNRTDDGDHVRYEGILRDEVATLVQDHVVVGNAIMPGAGFLDIMAAAAAAADEGASVSSSKSQDSSMVQMEDVIFERPLRVSTSAPPSVRIQVERTAASGSSHRLETVGILSRSQDEQSFMSVSTARVTSINSSPPDASATGGDLESVKNRCTRHVDLTSFYRQFSEWGFSGGPRFRTMGHLMLGDSEAVAYLQLTAPILPFERGFRVHPALLDGAFQSAFVVLEIVEAGADNGQQKTTQAKSTFVPAGADKVSFGRCSASDKLCSHVRLVRRDDTGAIIDVALYDSGGQVIVAIKHLHLRPIHATSIAEIPKELLWQLDWQTGSDGSTTLDKLTGTGEREASSVHLRCLLCGLAPKLKAKLEGCGAEERAALGLKTGSKMLACDELPAGRALELLLADEVEGAKGKGPRYLWDVILYLGGLSGRQNASEVDVLNEALCLAQAMLSLGRRVHQNDPPPIWLVTSGVMQPAYEQDRSLGDLDVMAHAGLWGFAKTARLELEANIGRRIQLGCIDVAVAPQVSASFLASLLTTVRTEREKPLNAYESEIVMRSAVQDHEGKRDRPVNLLYSRLKKSALQVRGAVELFLPRRGALSNLKLRPLAEASRMVPSAGCVEIRVRAVGLDFRDVLNVMGLYPGDPGPPGGDCSGTVVRVGAGVTHLGVGNDIYGVAPGCLRTYATTDARWMAVIPATVSFEQAAALPSVFVTVEVAFRELAQVKRGENVLVHVATGGVGLAALRYCQHVGATVYATAGSQAEKDYLRETCGIEYVTTSRDAERFKEDMLSFLERGKTRIDVVLNSLIDDYIPFSLDLVATNGRFMELGKRGTWTKDRVAHKRPDVIYEVIAVDHMMEESPEWFGSMLDRIRHLVEQGQIHSIPLHVFDIDSPEAASNGVAGFQFLQRAQHIGKVVLQIPSAIAARRTSGAEDISGARRTDGRQGSYVITGGVGGLGLVVAEWLVHEGAKDVVLVSRRGQPSRELAATALWQRLTDLTGDNGGESVIHCVAADVSTWAGCGSVFEQVGRPVAGIFHAAGVLEDAALAKQTRQSIERVYRPKVMGAWHLHEHCAREGLALSHLVFFSSAASMLGNIGQSNYAAANACLDALTLYRRSRGQCAVSIQWGPWLEQGMAAQLKQHFDTVGVRGISNELGLRVLGDVMRAATTGNSSRAVSVVGCQSLKWKTFLQTYEAHPPSFLQDVIPADKTTIESGGNGQINHALLKMDASTLKDHVRKKVLEKARQVLGGNEDSTPPLDAPLRESGIDSLGAVEFRNGLAAELDVKLSATTLFDYPTLNGIIGFIVQQIQIKTGQEQPGHQPSTMMPVSVSVKGRDALTTRIGVYGVSCRFPGRIDSLASLWSFVMGQQDAVCDTPADRWYVGDFVRSASSLDESQRAACLQAGYIVDGVEYFDNAFFGLSAAEATAMDPQQRIMLEVAHEAFLDAGHSREQLLGQTVGVVIAGSSYDWLTLGREGTTSTATADNKSTTKTNSDLSSSYAGVGSAVSILSNRISYVYGLRGNSMTIDTACSSSLVALDAGASWIRTGQCETVLVGGVQLMLSPLTFVHCSKAGMISPDCRSKTFDTSANGYVRGEGAGAVVLERQGAGDGGDDEAMSVSPWLGEEGKDGLARGLEEDVSSRRGGTRRREPLAVVLSSCVNHVGRSASLTAPSGSAQAELLGRALEIAGLRPHEVCFLETHGTGTSLGDPIEVGAIQRVYGGHEHDPAAIGESRQRRPLVLGAVKTNLGHLEAAAGMAGLLKTIAVLQHQICPPNLHLRTLNPFIDVGDATEEQHKHDKPEAPYATLNCVFPTEPISLKPTPTHTTIAAPRGQAAEDDDGHTGHHDDGHNAALIGAVSSFGFGGSNAHVILQCKPNQGRQAIEGVHRADQGACHHRERKVALMFTGQGSQYVYMGRELYESDSVFREAIDKCAALLDPHLSSQQEGVSLVELLYPSTSSAEERMARLIDETRFCQPVLFAVEYALYTSLSARGVVADVVMGHSLGEY